MCNSCHPLCIARPSTPVHQVEWCSHRPVKAERQQCGRGSVGRASPCQGEGREFESRRPLQIEGPGSLEPGPSSCPSTPAAPMTFGAPPPPGCPLRLRAAGDEHLIRGAVAAPRRSRGRSRRRRRGRYRAPGARHGPRPSPGAAVLDPRMPRADDVRVATALRDELPGCRTVIVTGHGRPGRLGRALPARRPRLRPDDLQPSGSPRSSVPCTPETVTGKGSWRPTPSTPGTSRRPRGRPRCPSSPPTGHSSRRSADTPRSPPEPSATTSPRSPRSRCRGPAHDSASHTGERLGIVSSALRRMRTWLSW